MFVALCLYFYIVGLLIGLPAWLILRRRRAMNLRAFTMIGLLAALVPVGPALAVVTLRGGTSAYVVAYNLALFGLGGMAAGSLFWRIACRYQGPKCN